MNFSFLGKFLLPYNSVKPGFPQMNQVEVKCKLHTYCIHLAISTDSIIVDSTISCGELGATEFVRQQTKYLSSIEAH